MAQKFKFDAIEQIAWSGKASDLYPEGVRVRILAGTPTSMIGFSWLSSVSSDKC
jgi:hypothetical protein